MEKKTSNPQRRQPKSNPTLLGGTFNILGILILLGIIAWVLLLSWFLAREFFLKNYDPSFFINEILNNEINYIQYYQPKNATLILTYIKEIQSASNFVSSYVESNPIVVNFIDTVSGISKIIVTRLSIFIMAMPFLMVIFGLFVIDGLVQRDIRKFRGERESTLFFHRAKLLCKKLFIFIFFLFMVLPCSASPEYILTPLGFVCGMTAMLSIKNFKKYM
jgi:hypothetical protein